MLKIGGCDTTSLALVSEHVQEVMLGIEWLKKNGVVWDVARGKITVGGKGHRLYNRTDGLPSCRRVVLQEDVVVPPRLEMDVSVKVVFKRLPGRLSESGGQPSLLSLLVESTCRVHSFQAVGSKASPFGL